MKSEESTSQGKVHKPCDCHFCAYQLPLIHEIQNSLKAHGMTGTLQDFDELINDLSHECEVYSTELECLKAKLDGTWPGFETREARLKLIK